MNQLLIVEDDATLAMNLKSFLTNEGFSVNHASRLAEIPQDLSDIDLIVLDWMLPDGQGLDKIKSLRKHNIYTPVVFLTAKSDLIDKVLGLESGANDYLTKPFEVRELLARIRVQLRRPEGLPPINSDFTFGNIRIIHQSRTVLKTGIAIDLTRKEYDLLFLLMSSPRTVFTREELLNKVWGFENFPTTRTVDTHILQLRQKLGDTYFETIRGIGYRFNNSPDKEMTKK